MSAVSVVIPVFNAARYLTGAMDSILAQTFRDFEVIAVDDGSTDQSGVILEDYALRDSRVRVIRRPNTGIVGALNDAIAVARGELIARMDADDISLPQRLEKQVAYLENHPDCVALGTDVLYTDPEGAPLIRHRPAEDHERIAAQLAEGNGGAMIHPSVIFRRSAVNKAGGYRVRYQWVEDLDMYLRLSEQGRLANLLEVHLQYRQHLGSVNSVRRDRNELRMELVNPRRSAQGLPALERETVEILNYSAADFRRHWAYDAARGGYWAAARKNGTRAVIGNPFDRRNWQCVRYVMASSYREATSARNAVPTFP